MRDYRLDNEDAVAARLEQVKEHYLLRLHNDPDVTPRRRPMDVNEVSKELGGNFRRVKR
jgi:hypothetical protein